MSWDGTAVISVVVLQNSMDVQMGEPGSSNETRVTSSIDENDATGIEARISDMSEVGDEETISVIMNLVPLTRHV